MSPFDNVRFNTIAGVLLFFLVLASPAAADDQTAGELHPQFDDEVREILNYAREGEWAQAEEAAEALRQRAPDDPRAQRLAAWVQGERARQADRRFQRELDDIAERDPRFSPTLRDFLREDEPYRLPLPDDLREAIEREEQRRLIPQTYGQVEGRPERPQPNEELNQKLEQRIDLDLEDTTVREVLLELRSATGINLAVAGDFPALFQPVTLQLTDVQTIDVLEYLAQNFDIRFVPRGDILWVQSPPQ